MVGLQAQRKKKGMAAVLAVTVSQLQRKEEKRRRENEMSFTCRMGKFKNVQYIYIPIGKNIEYD